MSLVSPQYQCYIIITKDPLLMLARETSAGLKDTKTLRKVGGLFDTERLAANYITSQKSTYSDVYVGVDFTVLPIY